MNDSKEYSRLVNLVDEAKEELDELGIPYGRISLLEVSHTVGTYGDCRKIGESSYRIRVNKILLAEAADTIVKDTIIHEILHTCNGCMNHGKTWQAYADLVNNAYPRYSISRLSSYDKTHVRLKSEKTAKYVVTCESCGHKYLHYRESRATILLSNPMTSHYCTCGYCHSNKLKLETKR